MHRVYSESPQFTKRCRLFWLTNSALAYKPKCRGRGGCGVSDNKYSCAHGAQINFGDLIPYLTYDPLCHISADSVTPKTLPPSPFQCPSADTRSPIIICAGLRVYDVYCTLFTIRIHTILFYTVLTVAVSDLAL